MDFKGPLKRFVPKSQDSGPKLSNLEVPVLVDYGKTPDSGFWKCFPKKELPTKPESKIDSKCLNEELEAVKDKISNSSYLRGKKAVSFLVNGAPSYQKSELGSCFVANSNSTIVHGSQVTDNVVTWLKNDFAAGPFDEPPLSNFRVNQLLAVVQPGKVRPVLNVSLPKDSSFNSNMDVFELEKVKMTSAKEFGETLLMSGKDSIMSKSDLVAAYKQVPCAISDLRNQGFMWLEKFFIETRQIFGAKSSVSNFDAVGETLKIIAQAKSDTSQSFILRQLDDLICVAPKDSGICENFTKRYKELCAKCNVNVADDCPLSDKAFSNQKRGKVLGVLFDTTDLTWKLPDKKAEKCLVLLEKALKDPWVSLLDLQRLHGRLNNICQMCPFLKCFKQPLNSCLEGKDDDPNRQIVLSQSAKDDILVWAGFLLSDLKWIPICPPIVNPPLRCITLISDAAGLPDINQVYKLPGCGSIGLDENGLIIFARQIIWPHYFICDGKDEKDVRFGDKSTCLEYGVME